MEMSSVAVDSQSSLTPLEMEFSMSDAMGDLMQAQDARAAGPLGHKASVCCNRRQHRKTHCCLATAGREETYLDHGVGNRIGNAGCQGAVLGHSSDIVRHFRSPVSIWSISLGQGEAVGFEGRRDSFGCTYCRPGGWSGSGRKKSHCSSRSMPRT